MIKLLLLLSVFVLIGCETRGENIRELAMCENTKLVGFGSEQDPYLIYDTHDFFNMRECNHGHYRIENDIDFNESPIDLGDSVFHYGIVPIELKFHGTLDGGNHTLYYEGDNPAHIFSSLADGAVVKNLVFDFDVGGQAENLISTREHYICDDEICRDYEKGDTKVAHLHSRHGYSLITDIAYEGSVIENIAFRGNYDIKLSNHVVRGADSAFNMGLAAAENRGIIRDIHVIGNVLYRIDNTRQNINIRYNVGNIAGTNRGEIKRVIIDGNVWIHVPYSGTNSRTGGVVGLNVGVIDHAINNARVTNTGGVAALLRAHGRAMTGGIAGRNNRDGIIRNSVFYGHLITTAGTQLHLGGITGYSEGVIEDAFIQMSYEYTGNWTTSSSSLIGGIIADGRAIRINNVYYIRKTPNESIDTYGQAMGNNERTNLPSSGIDTLFNNNFFSLDDWNYADEKLPRPLFEFPPWDGYDLIIGIRDEEETDSEEEEGDDSDA